MYLSLIIWTVLKISIFSKGNTHLYMPLIYIYNYWIFFSHPIYELDLNLYQQPIVYLYATNFLS